MNSAEHTGRLFRMACTVILSFVAAVFLLVSLAGYPAVAGAAEIAAVPGDADGNGVAEAQDAVLLQEYLLGEVTENALSPGADWDGNGTVDARDLVLLKRALQAPPTAATTTTAATTATTTTTAKSTSSTTSSRATTRKTGLSFDDVSGWSPLAP